MNQLLEWGPSRNDPDNPQSHVALQSAIDLRTIEGPRPDDN